jgi:chromosome segregation ATPase
VERPWGDVDVAELIERARYEASMSRPWSDLRPEERQTRVATGRHALAASGLLDWLDSADERMAVVERRAAAAERQRAELERQLGECAQYARALHASVEPLRQEALSATALLAAETQRADDAERVIRSLHRTERPPD